MGGQVRWLKVWHLESRDQTDPVLVRVSRLQRQGCPAEPTLLAVGENLQLLAVGYDDGAVVLHRGDITKDKGHKFKVVMEPGPTLACLSFKVAETGVFLYVATSQDVILINVTSRDKEVRTVLDSLGCSSKDLCMAPINVADTHFVTGQSDAVYCYNTEGRGQCYAFEGKKRLLSWFRGYLTIVSDEGPDKATVTVFDVQNKFIAFSAPIKPVMSVLSEWGSIMLVTQEGKIHQMSEKDTQTKLSLLFKKNFYDVAIKIAKNQQVVDSEGLVDIFRQYGDHLYAKGDAGGAIEQYVKTIGTLEPSYVIQRFLDAQKIHNLTAYLQALHRKGLASEDHTTLLLNCYTKLKDSAKLDEFIMTKDREVDFDVDIAISVCRQAGYCRHAMALASKHGKHDLYLAIIVEVERDYSAALEYISSLSLQEALTHASKYGAILIQHCPEETALLLKRLCVDGTKAGLQVTAEDFIPFFISDQSAMVDFLSHLTSSLPPASLGSTVYSTLIEYSLYCWASCADTSTKTTKQREVMELLQAEEVQYNRDQALLLCRQTGFTPGLLLLYQQAGLYHQILAHHLTSGNWEAGLQACRRFGPSRPQLWVTALQQVAACGSEVPPAQFREVLEQVERHRLLSPLQVVSALSTCPTATLGVVRDYLLRTLDLEEKSIQEDQRVIAQYQAQSAELRDKIDKLTGHVTVFQSTKCSACSQDLELPTVHFLCRHGYHQHCFQSYSESDQECPACHGENKKILDMVRSQEAGRHLHDQFHAQLEKAEDGFTIVAEYFGRGLFSSPLPVATPAVRTNGGVPAAPPQTEARIRAETKSAGVQIHNTEARLRAEAGTARTSVSPSPSETPTLRAGHTLGTSIPSRQTGSIAANLSQSLAPRMGPLPSPHTVLRREDIKPANPFGSPDSGSSLGDDNPFAETSVLRKPAPGPAPVPTNPFGDDCDGYDEEKNPFAD